MQSAILRSPAYRAEPGRRIGDRSHRCAWQGVSVSSRLAGWLTRSVAPRHDFGGHGGVNVWPLEGVELAVRRGNKGRSH